MYFRLLTLYGYSRSPLEAALPPCSDGTETKQEPNEKNDSVLHSLPTAPLSTRGAGSLLSLWPPSAAVHRRHVEG
jgi:hypothetical protein